MLAPACCRRQTLSVPFGWAAILGPVARSAPTGLVAVAHDRTRSLDREYELGGWLMRPGDEQFVEYYRPEPHSLAGALQICTWPIIVEGPGAADPFDRPTMLRLHRLACLLALGWAEPWQVRSAPWPTTQRSAAVPDSWPPPPLWWGGRPPPLRRDEPLPALVVDHWDTLEERPAVARALSIWHQGVLVQEWHPSLALVAYVAAIDGLGHRGLSSRQRLARAVEAFGDEFVAGQINRLYDLRSATVHAGATHGFEDSFGIVADLGPTAAPGTTAADLLGAVSAVRRVSGAALINALEA